MAALIQDVGYFLRSVRRAPGFFAVAVLTLALGIGANTALFSVINAVLLRPLPFQEPDRLVRLFETEAAPGNYPLTGPDYLDWKAKNRTLESTALLGGYGRVNVSGGAEPDWARSLEVEPTFFKVLGVRPLLGRGFRPEDGRGDSERVAVLSYGFWQRQFGGDPGVLGRKVELSARHHVVIGVMPSWFNYPRNTEIWTAFDIAPQNLGQRGNHSYEAIARLKPGISVQQALADLSVIAKQLEKQYPDSNDQIGASVVPLKEQLTARSREPLLILLGAVALVLLVACANVANLLLVRAGLRRRELAIRSAIGAGRGRVVRQLLTESLLLALVGAGAGLAAAWWGVRLLRSVKTLPIPMVNSITIDQTVLFFTLGAALFTGLLFGILPALQASGSGVSEELKSAGGRSVLGSGHGGRRLRDAIAVAEIAVSLALLVGAGLLLRSFEKMRTAETGLGTRNVLTLAVSLPEPKYPNQDSREQFYARLLDRLRAVPGVQAAAASTQVPLEGGSNGYITVPGQDNARLRNQLFEWLYATNDYFRVYRIPLLQGRTLTAADEAHASAVNRRISEIFAAPNPDLSALRGVSWPVVINRTMARLIWPKEDPLGKVFVMGGILNAEVVGVVADVKVRGIRSSSLPQAYLPFVGTLDRAGSRYVAVRTEQSPASVLSAVKAQLKAIDPTLAVITPRTLDDIVADGMADTTLQTWLLGVFSLVAVMLAGIGLFSVMASLVAQRRHEIGIRTALGARPVDLLGLVMAHAGRLTILGLVAGVASALALTRMMRSLLFGVEANDPLTFVLVSLFVALVALTAAAVPARRAAKTDPLIALRYE
jgi:putative ABC transport system permease protein